MYYDSQRVSAKDEVEVERNTDCRKERVKLIGKRRRSTLMDRESCKMTNEQRTPNLLKKENKYENEIATVK